MVMAAIKLSDFSFGWVSKIANQKLKILIKTLFFVLAKMDTFLVLDK